MTIINKQNVTRVECTDRLIKWLHVAPRDAKDNLKGRVNGKLTSLNYYQVVVHFVGNTHSVYYVKKEAMNKTQTSNISDILDTLNSLIAS